MAFDFQVNNFSAFPFPTIQGLVHCIVAFNSWVCDLEAQCISTTLVKKSGFAFSFQPSASLQNHSQRVTVAHRKAVRPKNHMSKNPTPHPITTGLTSKNRLSKKMYILLT
jgi:hypothetical protein